MSVRFSEYLMLHIQIAELIHLCAVFTSSILILLQTLFKSSIILLHLRQQRRNSMMKHHKVMYNQCREHSKESVCDRSSRWCSDVVMWEKCLLSDDRTTMFQWIHWISWCSMLNKLCQKKTTEKKLLTLNDIVVWSWWWEIQMKKMWLINDCTLLDKQT
jgi:hypothetical protein